MKDNQDDLGSKLIKILDQPSAAEQALRDTVSNLKTAGSKLFTQHGLVQAYAADLIAAADELRQLRQELAKYQSADQQPSKEMIEQVDIPTDLVK